MKTSFIQYLKKIGLSKVLIDRVDKLHSYATILCPENIIDIFIAEYEKQNGSRVYENLWFFSKNYALESKQFSANDNIDIMFIKRKLVHLEINLNAYNFKKATKQSRIRLDIQSIRHPLEMQFKASQENCDFLKTIINKYFKSNLMY